MKITAKMIYKMKSSCRAACLLDTNKLRTSINVRKEYQNKIYSYAASHNMKTCEVIRVLILRMICLISQFDHFAFRERPMIYQNEGFSYSAMHVSFSPDEYSRCKDVICASRFCLSAIVGMAMLIFDEIMSEKEETNDSYPEDEYLKLKIIKNNSPIYINSWGNKTKKRTKNKEPAP